MKPHILGQQAVPSIGEKRLDWSNVGTRRLPEPGAEGGGVPAYGMGSRCASCMVALSVVIAGVTTEEEVEEAHVRFDEMRREHERICPARGQLDAFGSGART